MPEYRFRKSSIVRNADNSRNISIIRSPDSPQQDPIETLINPLLTRLSEMMISKRGKMKPKLPPYVNEVCRRLASHEITLATNDKSSIVADSSISMMENGQIPILPISIPGKCNFLKIPLFIFGYRFVANLALFAAIRASCSYRYFGLRMK